MKTFAAPLLCLTLVLALAGCGEQESPAPQSDAQNAVEHVEAPPVSTVPDAAEPDAAAAEEPAQAPAEAISETGDEPQSESQTSSVQPSLRLGTPLSGPPTSARFREGTHYQKLVPAQPSSVGPDKVEVAEVFWYGCGHCFTLDPALESWRDKKPAYIEFTRVPAMWNDITRMHARLFYTIDLLGKLDELHTLIFREIHVNGNQLNTVDKISSFLQQHGIGADEFQKAFSSFAVESKLQRADFLNRRYRVQSVPMIVVNGKYTTDVSSAGSEANLFALIEELAAHESGG